MEVHEAPAAERRVRGGIAPSPDPRLLGPCCGAAPLLQPYIGYNSSIAEDAVARLDDCCVRVFPILRLELEVVLVKRLRQTDTIAKLS